MFSWLILDRIRQGNDGENVHDLYSMYFKEERLYDYSSVSLSNASDPFPSSSSGRQFVHSLQLQMSVHLSPFAMHTHMLFRHPDFLQPHDINSSKKSGAGFWLIHLVSSMPFVRSQPRRQIIST